MRTRYRHGASRLAPSLTMTFQRPTQGLRSFPGPARRQVRAAGAHLLPRASLADNGSQQSRRDARAGHVLHRLRIAGRLSHTDSAARHRVFDSAQRASAPLAAPRVSKLADGAMAHCEGETLVMKAANRRSMRCVGVLLVAPQRISGEAWGLPRRVSDRRQQRPAVETSRLACVASPSHSSRASSPIASSFIFR